MRPLQDKRKYLIPQTAKISCATKLQINGKDALVLIDPCTIHRNLISNEFCDMYNILIEKTD